MARAISFAEREAILHRWRNRNVSADVLSFSEVGSLLLGVPADDQPHAVGEVRWLLFLVCNYRSFLAVVGDDVWGGGVERRFIRPGLLAY